MHQRTASSTQDGSREQKERRRISMLTRPRSTLLPAPTRVSMMIMTLPLARLIIISSLHASRKCLADRWLTAYSLKENSRHRQLSRLHNVACLWQPWPRRELVASRSEPSTAHQGLCLLGLPRTRLGQRALVDSSEPRSITYRKRCPHSLP